MLKHTIVAALFSALSIAGANAASRDNAPDQSMKPALAQALDQVGAEFTRHNREHRMMEIQRNMDRQQRGGRGYGRGYGPRPGYGPAPGYGARRGYYNGDAGIPATAGPPRGYAPRY